MMIKYVTVVENIARRVARSIGKNPRPVERQMLSKKVTFLSLQKIVFRPSDKKMKPNGIFVKCCHLYKMYKMKIVRNFVVFKSDKLFTTKTVFAEQQDNRVNGNSD
jgi:hypothetical protein